MRVFLFLLFLSSSLAANSQYFATEKRLISQVESSKTIQDKIASLEKLAEFYYIYRAEKKADSVLKNQLSLAEESNNDELILNALFGSALTGMNAWASQETFDRATAFVDKGLSHARSIGNKEFESIAYLRRAEIARKRGKLPDALQDITLALSSLGNEDRDSLKVVIYLETGDILAKMNKAVDAYKSYNNAFDLAYTIGNSYLQSETYHRISGLYRDLDHKDLALKTLYKSLELNQLNHDKVGILKDYIDIARVTEEKGDVEKMLAAYNSSLPERLKFLVKRTNFSFLQIRTNDTEKTRKYLEENEDLKQSFINAGIANYYYNLGHIYHYSGNADSAIHYYSIAIPDLLATSGDVMKVSLFKQMGDAYSMAKKNSEAIASYLKALGIAKQINHLKNIEAISEQLSKVSATAGDFKAAFQYSADAELVKETLDSLAERREVVRLEIEQENNKHEKDLEDLQAATLRTRNLQYIGISLATAAFFIVLIFIGMFPTSRFSMKMLSFFAFICLFEFIILLIDTWLHHITHAEPLKIWLAKIGIIAILLPLHHYLDHLSYQFLTSHKLEKLRQQFSVKRIISKIKVVAPDHATHTPTAPKVDDKTPVA